MTRHLMRHERAAADAQGITAIVSALAAHDLSADIENAGGCTMVAVITLPDGDVVALTDGRWDGLGSVMVGRFTAAAWAGDDLHAEPEPHEFPDVAAAAWWIRDRIADLTPLPEDATLDAVSVRLAAHGLRVTVEYPGALVLHTGTAQAWTGLVSWDCAFLYDLDGDETGEVARVTLPAAPTPEAIAAAWAAWATNPVTDVAADEPTD